MRKYTNLQFCGDTPLIIIGFLSSNRKNTQITKYYSKIRVTIDNMLQREPIKKLFLSKYFIFSNFNVLSVFFLEEIRDLERINS